MALIPWYFWRGYENGVEVAWVKNAQQIDDAAETSPPLGRDYLIANLSPTRTFRVKFVTRQGNVDSRDVAPNTPETPVRLPPQYNDYDGWREIGWLSPQQAPRPR